MPEAESEKPMCDDIDTSVDTSDSGMDTPDTSMDTDTGMDATEDVDDSGMDCEDAASDALTDDTGDVDDSGLNETSDDTSVPENEGMSDDENAEEPSNDIDEDGSETSSDAESEAYETEETPLDDEESTDSPENDAYDSDAEGLPDDESENNSENSSNDFEEDSDSNSADADETTEPDSADGASDETTDDTESSDEQCEDSQSDENFEDDTYDSDAEGLPEDESENDSPNASDDFEEDSDSNSADADETTEPDSTDGTFDENGNDASDEAIDDTESSDEPSKEAQSDDAPEDEAYNSDAEGLPENDESKDNNDAGNAETNDTKPSDSSDGDESNDNEDETVNDLPEDIGNAPKDNSLDQKISPEKEAALKERLRDRQEHPEKYPDKQSGYGDFDQGKTDILTEKPAKLSSKNFDRLAQERGLSPEDANNLKYSFNEYKKPDPSLNGAEHHPEKSPEDYATARHILEPEQAHNYNNGMVRDGYDNASSGVFQSPNIQSSDGKPEQVAAQENLALPTSNDARVRSDTTINPTLDDGKQHNVIEGTAAPQNHDGADSAFKANDGIDRHGGGRQIVTDGGYNTGAVTGGTQHNIGDMSTDLNNPNLFKNHPAGEYGYTNAPSGKSGFGQLDNSVEGVRNPMAQRTVGGIDRQKGDDGGHYIAARFNGDSGYKNLDAQASGLNRGDWKAMENNQAKMLDNGDKVFTNNRSVKHNGSERPDSYDAYTIVEHPDGSREAIPYHFENTSNNKNKEQ